MTSRRSSLALALVVAAVFGVSVSTHFVWDDLMLISGNTRLSEPDAVQWALTSDFWNTTVPNNATHGYWRPIPKLSHVLLARVAGQRTAWPFHLANVALHLATVLTVAAWLRRRYAQADAQALTATAAFAGAVLFAVHPSRFEAVGWVACSTELFFGLSVALTAWAAERERPHALAGLLLLGAAFSKETALVVPVLLAFDALLRGRWAKVRGLTIVSALSVGSAWALRRWLELPTPPLLRGGTPLDLVARVLAALAGYARRTLVPDEATVITSDTRALEPGVFDVSTAEWLTGLVLVSLGLALCVWAWRRPAARGWLADVGWWLVPLAPVLQLAPLPSPTLVSDRFLYVPLMGIAALVTRGLLARADTGRPLRPFALALAGLSTASAVMVALALPAYGSNRGFFEREFLLHPGHVFASESYARDLLYGGHPWAARDILGAVLERELPPYRRMTIVALYADAVRMTSRDVDAAQLDALSAFYETLETDHPAPLVVQGRSWAVAVEPARSLMVSSDAVNVREARAVVQARRGDPSGLVRLLSLDRKNNPTPGVTLRLATQLAAWERWNEALFVLDQDTARYPWLANEPRALTLRELSRVKPAPPPSDGVDYALVRARFLGSVEAYRQARAVLAPHVERHALEPRFVDARVQVEVLDHDYERALALLTEAAAQLPGQGFEEALNEVRAAREEWNTFLTAEHELAAPASR